MAFSTAYTKPHLRQPMGMKRSAPPRMGMPRMPAGPRKKAGGGCPHCGSPMKCKGCGNTYGGEGVTSQGQGSMNDHDEDDAEY